MTDLQMRAALQKYCTQVSILKKGYGQEKYRIEQNWQDYLRRAKGRKILCLLLLCLRRYCM